MPTPGIRSPHSHGLNSAVHLQDLEIHARALGTIYSLATVETLYAPVTRLTNATCSWISVAPPHVYTSAGARHMTWHSIGQHLRSPPMPQGNTITLSTLLYAYVQVNYFKDKADTAISESNSAFQVTVNGAPKPSDA